MGPVFQFAAQVDNAQVIYTHSTRGELVMRILCLAMVLAVPAARAQAPDPLAADPQHYHLEVENQWVRVIREHMGPNEKMPMHQHPVQEPSSSFLPTGTIG